MNKHMVFIALLLFGFLLSGCSAWKEDFEQKPVRGYPKASIHEISTMVNRGEIKEDDAGSITTISLNSDISSSATSFYDGEISRGYEKVQRIYVASYEDENKILHEAHNLYVVVKPAEWTFYKGQSFIIIVNSTSMSYCYDSNDILCKIYPIYYAIVSDAKPIVLT